MPVRGGGLRIRDKLDADWRTLHELGLLTGTLRRALDEIAED